MHEKTQPESKIGLTLHTMKLKVQKNKSVKTACLCHNSRSCYSKYNYLKANVFKYW